jgi:hypothetical protein
MHVRWTSVSVTGRACISLGGDDYSNLISGAADTDRQAARAMGEVAVTLMTRTDYQ